VAVGTCGLALASLGRVLARRRLPSATASHSQTNVLGPALQPQIFPLPDARHSSFLPCSLIHPSRPRHDCFRRITTPFDLSLVFIALSAVITVLRALSSQPITKTFDLHAICTLETTKYPCVISVGYPGGYPPSKKVVKNRKGRVVSFRGHAIPLNLAGRMSLLLDEITKAQVAGTEIQLGGALSLLEFLACSRSCTFFDESSY